MSEPVNQGLAGVPCGARRLQSAADVLTAVVLAMLVWPFPVARATLTPGVHVLGVFVMCLAVLLAYYVISAAVWRKTLGMRLAGLELRGETSPPERLHLVSWGLTAAVFSAWYVLAPKSACRYAPDARSARVWVSAE